jgi:threonine synthase
VESALSHLECARCRRAHDSTKLQQRCECGGALLARYDFGGIDLAKLRERPPGMWRYRELLPVQAEPVSLGEPETALLPLPRLSERWGCEVWLKDDGPLPGGTFKARGAAVGLTRAVELGATALVLPSAGNAGGAWALYAARAGLPIAVTMARTSPETNHAEVRMAGGELVLVDGTLADAGRRAVGIARDRGAFLATTFTEPYRLEGKKSCWLEVFDRLGDRSALGGPASSTPTPPNPPSALGGPASSTPTPPNPRMRFPRSIVLPVGGGVAAVAAAKAAEEVAALGWCADDPPRIVGAQAADCAPVVRAFETGASDVRAWSGEPTTIAAGLRVPRPPEGALLLTAVRASRGTMLAVAEPDIVASVTDLASTEGVFACPEGATAVAAAARLAAEGRLEGPAVLYNTGAGAKYADALARAFGDVPPPRIRT